MIWKLVIVAMAVNWQATSEHGAFETREACLEAVELLLTPQAEHDRRRGTFVIDNSGWGPIFASVTATCVPVEEAAHG